MSGATLFGKSRIGEPGYWLPWRYRLALWVSCLSSLLPTATWAATLPDSLLAVVRTSRAKPQQVLALIKLSAYYRPTDSTLAYQYAARAVALTHQRPTDTLAARALLALGSAYRVHGNYRAATNYFRQALAQAQRLGQARLRAQSYREIGLLESAQGHFPQAWAAIHRELPLRQALRDSGQLMRLYNNMGSLAQNQGDYPGALRGYLAALKMAERTRDSAEIAFVSANLGGVYKEQGDLPTAISYLRQAAAIQQTLRDTVDMIASFADLGDTYTNLARYSAAAQCLRRSFQLGQALGTRGGEVEQAQAYFFLGHLQALQHQPGPALRSLRLAEATFQRLQLPRYLVGVLTLQVRAYQAIGQLKNAERAAQQALALAQRTHSVKDAEWAYEVLATLRASRQDFAAAYAYRQQYEAAHDSLFNGEKTQALAELRTRYDLRNKEAQIALLRTRTTLLESEAWGQRRLGIALGGGLLLASLLGISWYRRYRFQRAAAQRLQAQEAEIISKNADLERTQQRLRAALGEKNVLIKEVHHRAKNNLQIVASLFALQSSENPHNTLLTAALQEGQNRIQAIALVHELLSQSGNPTRVDFNQFLHQLATHLAQAFVVPDRPRRAPAGVLPSQELLPPPAVTCAVQAAGVSLNASTAIPLGLAVNELLSNAFQHAFANGRPGHVDLRITGPDEAGVYALTVRDNGVGLPAGFSLAKASSLGLRLVSNLARQLRGTFRVAAGGPGAGFYLTFQEVAENLKFLQAVSD